MAIKKGKGIQTISLIWVSTVNMSIAGPIVTDNGNFVIDAPFDQEKMQDPCKVCFPPIDDMSPFSLTIADPNEN